MAAALRAGAVGVVVVGTVPSVLIAQGWQATVARQRDERLDRTAAVRTATISTALRHYENALQAARSLWIASEEVSREEFRAFANALELTHRYPGLQSIGWREVVVVADAADFVRQARADGATGFTIRPPGRRPAYYVMKYSHPTTLLGSQLGLDARAIPSVLANLERARETGETVISSQTTLVDDLPLLR